MQEASPRRVYESSLDLINDVIRKVARRNRLSEDETDEFWSDVHLKLIKDDFRALREYRGAGTLERFIVAVATRELLDRRIKKWGKWRPTLRAKRMGPVAILFERLVNRDGLDVENAIETLRTNYGVISDEELQRLATELSVRRRVETERGVDLDALPHPGSRRSTEQNVVLREQKLLAARIQPVFSRAFATLDPEDRVLFRLFYERGFTWAQIARVRGLDAQRIYRLKETVHRGLRTALEAEDTSLDQLEELLEQDLLDIKFDGGA